MSRKNEGLPQHLGQMSIGSRSPTPEPPQLPQDVPLDANDIPAFVQGIRAWFEEAEVPIPSPGATVPRWFSATQFNRSLPLGVKTKLYRFGAPVTLGAVKRYAKEDRDKVDQLRRLESPYLAVIYGYTIHDDGLFLSMEFLHVSLKDLETIGIFKQFSVKLKLHLQGVYREYTFQLLGALDWLAVHGLVHGQLDTSHVMLKLTKNLNADGSSLAKTDLVKLVGLDFMCREGKQTAAEIARPSVVDLAYVAPEIIENGGVARTHKSDIYAAGKVLLAPVGMADERPEDIAKRMGEHFISLVASMTLDDPNHRPHAMSARGYAFFEPAKQSLRKEDYNGSLWNARFGHKEFKPSVEAEKDHRRFLIFLSLLPFVEAYCVGCLRVFSKTAAESHKCQDKRPLSEGGKLRYGGAPNDKTMKDLFATYEAKMASAGKVTARRMYVKATVMCATCKQTWLTPARSSKKKADGSVYCMVCSRSSTVGTVGKDPCTKQVIIQKTATAGNFDVNLGFNIEDLLLRDEMEFEPLRPVGFKQWVTKYISSRMELMREWHQGAADAPRAPEPILMYADRRRQLREKRLHPGSVLILASHCTGLKHPRTNADLSYPPDAVLADVSALTKCFAKRGFVVKIPRHADGSVVSDFSREDFLDRIQSFMSEGPHGEAKFIFVMTHGSCDASLAHRVVCCDQDQRNPEDNTQPTVEFAYVTRDIVPLMNIERGRAAAESFRFLIVTACAGLDQEENKSVRTGREKDSERAIIESLESDPEDLRKRSSQRSHSRSRPQNVSSATEATTSSDVNVRSDVSATTSDYRRELRCPSDMSRSPTPTDARVTNAPPTTSKGVRAATKAAPAKGKPSKVPLATSPDSTEPGATSVTPPDAPPSPRKRKGKSRKKSASRSPSTELLIAQERHAPSVGTLVAYAAMNGYVSYSSKDKRNYYVKEFIDAVEEHYLNQPIKFILEEVGKKIDTYLMAEKHTQTAGYTSLMHELYFFPNVVEAGSSGTGGGGGGSGAGGSGGAGGDGGSRGKGDGSGKSTGTSKKAQKKKHTGAKPSKSPDTKKKKAALESSTEAETVANIASASGSADASSEKRLRERKRKLEAENGGVNGKPVTRSKGRRVK